jgi:phosphoribosylanthranilate isomerase
MWVKICGLIRREDALAAAGLGADAIGFVFTESRRRADPGEIGKWINEIKGVEKVGVFTDEPVEEILEIAGKLKLDSVQLHTGLNETHKLLEDRIKIIVAIKGQAQGVIPAIKCRILIDPSMGTAGKADWKPYPFPFILAGGLTPENVREAIFKAHPAGVDVSSGIEISPGIKDIEKTGKFIMEAKS